MAYIGTVNVPLGWRKAKRGKTRVLKDSTGPDIFGDSLFGQT